MDYILCPIHWALPGHYPRSYLGLYRSDILPKIPYLNSPAAAINEVVLPTYNNKQPNSGEQRRVQSSPVVKQISECFIKPKLILEEAKQPLYLSPWDLSVLSVHYNQKGLLFAKPPSDHPKNSINSFLEDLKDSLSSTLTHFYPLASRLATQKQDNPPSCFISVEPYSNRTVGAKFIHATVDLNISDLLTPADVPLVIHSFFAHSRAINHDGHNLPLLIIQVTELIDGIFIGCTVNHTIADGTSFWHFINMWSEMFEAKGHTSRSISRPPIHRHQSWLPIGYPLQYDPIINLPFTHHTEFIFELPENPLLRERVYHFSSNSLAKLKAKANLECETNKISTFLALAALVWRCVTRARRLPTHHQTSCRIIVNNRSRLDPPLSENYFGNPIQSVTGIAGAGELLDKGLGWSAWLLREAVANHTNTEVHKGIESRLKRPIIVTRVFNSSGIHFGSSPRFDIKVDGFGLGKPVAIRSGNGNKFDGKMNTYPGLEGKGGIVLELCLLPDTIGAFESDEEFMDALGL